MFSPVLFLLTIVVFFLVMMGEAETPKYIRYSTVTGFFQQDDPATDASTFDYVSASIAQACCSCLDLLLLDSHEFWLDQPRI
jgi:hypothetical protein